MRLNLRKILVTAYECAPNVGSEPGVGWNWALELARTGHDVWLLTSEESQVKIDKAVAEGLELPENLHFSCVDILGKRVWREDYQRLIRTHYSLWQILAFYRARRLHREQHFDVVHHLTPGVIRHPSYMGFLGIPFFAGPLGGGEHAPCRLFKGVPWRWQAFEKLRNMTNMVVKIDPFMWLTYSRATKIYCKTEESVRAIPARFRHKAEQRLEIGCDRAILDKAGNLNTSGGDTLRLIYAGRLLHWKGLHIGIRALASARASGVDCSLTLVGDGPMRSTLEQLARELGVSDYVSWRGVVTQPELFRLYREHDALLFPSLHDSSGNVVLEAMAFGLPVICLDLGGPPVIVGDHGGCIVATERKSVEQVAQGMALAIASLSDREQLAQRANACRQRAASLTWTKTVADTYRDMAESLSMVEERAVQ